jgi:hypothetical protein
MNIQDDKHFVTIPKAEYQQMEKAVNDSKNINVEFRLSTLDYSGYGNGNYRTLHCYRIVHEINTDKISQELIGETEKMIDAACNEVANRKDKQIKEMAEELKGVYSKWWYKLFA